MANGMNFTGIGQIKFALVNADPSAAQQQATVTVNFKANANVVIASNYAQFWRQRLSHIRSCEGMEAA